MSLKHEITKIEKQTAKIASIRQELLEDLRDNPECNGYPTDCGFCPERCPLEIGE